MTAQIPETLHYENKKVALCTEPLNDYFAMGGSYPGFEMSCTALWRGYVGEWEIINDRLYLIGLNGTLEDGSTVTLATLFPAFPDRVFAHWYSGTLRIPQGKQLKYVHSGYASTYEQDLFLDVERGIVVSTRIQQNGIAASEAAPEGYAVAAMTVFPHREPRDHGDGL